MLEIPGRTALLAEEKVKEEWISGREDMDEWKEGKLQSGNCSVFERVIKKKSDKYNF